jgi:hyperosmotically inducible protein
MRTTFKVALLTVALNALVACAATRTHESAGEVVDDSTITTKVKTELIANRDTKARQIDVKTYRGVVELSGFVDSSQEKSEAARVARGVTGVRDVNNELEVKTADRTVGVAIDDTILTTKVKTALIANPITKAHEIEVTTRNGVVQLAGFVDSEEERTTAVSVTMGVQGVKSVDNALKLKPAP